MRMALLGGFGRLFVGGEFLRRLGVARIAGEPGSLNILQITIPKRLLIFAEFFQILIAVESGIVAVVKAKTQGIVPHGVHAVDADVHFPDLQFFFSGGMTLHLRRRRKHA